MSIIGVDSEGRVWFKSDQNLTDITDAVDFHVRAYGVWKKKYYLIATIVNRPAYYRDAENQRGYVPPITESKTIGVYEKQSSISNALDNVMRLKEIREIDPFDPIPESRKKPMGMKKS